MFVVPNDSYSMNAMTSAEAALQRAAHIQLDFNDDVLMFSYTNVDGVAWDGCIEEWIGNDDAPTPEDLIVELDGTRYYQIGASGGGADLVLLRDDETGAICYFNDYDRTVSRVATNVDEFVALLRSPK